MSCLHHFPGRSLLQIKLKGILIFFKKLEYNCFTMLCLFLLCNEVNQLYQMYLQRRFSGDKYFWRHFTGEPGQRDYSPRHAGPLVGRLTLGQSSSCGFGSYMSGLCVRCGIVGVGPCPHGVYRLVGKVALSKRANNYVSLQMVIVVIKDSNTVKC